MCARPPASDNVLLMDETEGDLTGMSLTATVTHKNKQRAASVLLSQCVLPLVLKVVNASNSDEIQRLTEEFWNEIQVW